MVPVHRVNTALSMLKVRRGAVICPSMAGSLVRGFGLMFLPLQQPTVKWRIAAFTRARTPRSPAVDSFLNFTLEFARGWAPIKPEIRGGARKLRRPRPR
jgi:DNA-binding transcriptional LysR family regulator